MNLTPLKAIKAKCLDCCCGSFNEVKLCPITNCPLHFYRYGKNPNRKGKGNPKGNPNMNIVKKHCFNKQNKS